MPDPNKPPPRTPRRPHPPLTKRACPAPFRVHNITSRIRTTSIRNSSSSCAGSSSFPHLLTAGLHREVGEPRTAQQDAKQGQGGDLLGVEGHLAPQAVEEAVRRPVDLDVPPPGRPGGGGKGARRRRRDGGNFALFLAAAPCAKVKKFRWVKKSRGGGKQRPYRGNGGNARD